jgi:adenine-specific DNA-methyltransferase
MKKQTLNTAKAPVPLSATRKSGGELDPVTGGPVQPDGAGMYLHWDGRKNYRTRIPAPRVLEPVAALSCGDVSENKIIEGDNLQAMVSLRSQYRAMVDVAYLDPPYNTGNNDFRYSDRRFNDPNADFDDSVYVSNEDGGRHTKWLNYIAPRLHLVHDLLADHGVCFVSISDIELFRLGMLMDEIFGESNRLGIVVWKQAIDNNPTRIVTEHEYVLCYAKAKEDLPPSWTGTSEVKEWLLDTYKRLRDEAKGGVPALAKAYRAAIREHVEAYTKDIEAHGKSELVNLGRASRYNNVDEKGPYAAEDNTHNPKPGGYVYDVRHPGTKKICKKPSNGYRFPAERMKQLQEDGRLVFGKDETTLFKVKKYVEEMSGPLRSVISIDGRVGTNLLKRLLPRAAERFPHPKPVELIQHFIDMAGDTEALVLDPFAGSGTTAHAVLRLNHRDGGRRRFLLIEEGNPDDRYCRTVTAPRVKAAIKKEGLPGGFAFLETGRKLNREAILDLERKAITSLIIQTDSTGAGRGIARIEGKHVIGSNVRKEAICLRWNGRADSTVTTEVLREMFAEAKTLGLSRPLRVYGSTCVVGETDSFRFCQIPDEIIAALNLEDEGDLEELEGESLTSAVETFESASQGLAKSVARS